MAMGGRIRSALPLLNRILRSDSLSTDRRSAIQRTVLCPAFSPSSSKFSRNYSAASVQKQDNIKVPVPLFGVFGNYASALFLAAKKANALDQVESELLNFVQSAKRSEIFSQFMHDLSVNAETRVKAMDDICTAAKFSEITKNFLVIVAGNGKLKNIETIIEKFMELTMADKGIVKAVVTTVIPLPPEEEKELKETLQDVLGQGKQVTLEQKIDPSILGGIVVEFGQKMFDMSIKTRAEQMERFLREPVNF